MKEIAKEIDFADSSYEGCEANHNDLIIRIKLWNCKIIKLIFKNAIKFEFNEGSFVEGIFEESLENTFLKNALSAYYRNIPEDNPFKCFYIKDIDDQFIFQIVSEEMQIKVDMKIYE